MTGGLLLPSPLLSSNQWLNYLTVYHYLSGLQIIILSLSESPLFLFRCRSYLEHPVLSCVGTPVLRVLGHCSHRGWLLSTALHMRCHKVEGCGVPPELGLLLPSRKSREAGNRGSGWPQMVPIQTPDGLSSRQVFPSP